MHYLVARGPQLQVWNGGQVVQNLGQNQKNLIPNAKNIRKGKLVSNAMQPLKSKQNAAYGITALTSLCLTVILLALAFGFHFGAKKVSHIKIGPQK